jgi:hypothetical protein
VPIKQKDLMPTQEDKDREFDEFIAILGELKASSEGITPFTLAKRMLEKGFSPSAAFVGTIMNVVPVVRGWSEIPFMPVTLPPVISEILKERQAALVCDPWAGIGAVLATAVAATNASRSFAFVHREDEFVLGSVLVSSAEWTVGDPLHLLAKLDSEIDVVASIPPFGAKPRSPLKLRTMTGDALELSDDLGSLLLTASSARLSNDGIGIFVVAATFFSSPHSVLRIFGSIGLFLQAALALPSGAFAPHTNISTYLVVVTKRATDRLFVGQLSKDTDTNLQVVTNFRERRQGPTLELGRYVTVDEFTGLDSLRIAERVKSAKQTFDAAAWHLEDLSATITLGRPNDSFTFPAADNEVFVPMIGNSSVIDSRESLTLKLQNYSQVVIDPTRSLARFVAQFLNTELGKEIRELNKSGSVIRKLNLQTLKSLIILIPDIATQRAILETEVQISSHGNLLSELQSQLMQLRRELWNRPQARASVQRQLAELSSRISGSVKEHAERSFEEWIETLPFPLASILRAWLATASDDFKTKYEHLLHFFEATAEFIGIIFLSAFSSNESLFKPHKQKLTDAMNKVNLSYSRATFGVWKVVVEYLGKQTRDLLNGSEERKICGELFADPSLSLPTILSRVELANSLTAVNKMRNDWTGHGGVVGPEVAQLRNEQLLAQLQSLRNILSDVWAGARLVHPIRGVKRKGIFENELQILMGSNSPFLSAWLPMATLLDSERIHIVSEGASFGLTLLPLVHIGSSPLSAKNAFYFFNRLDRDGARFISYHYVEKPELTGQFADALQTIRYLTGVELEGSPSRN